MRLHCEECLSDVISSTDLVRPADTLLQIKDRGGLVTPSTTVLQITNAAESATREVLRVDCLRSDSPRKIINLAMTYIYQYDIHQKFTCYTHCAELIREIVQRYVHIRMHHESVKSHSGPVVRSKLNRLIIFSHV